MNSVRDWKKMNLAVTVNGTGWRSKTTKDKTPNRTPHILSLSLFSCQSIKASHLSYQYQSPKVTLVSRTSLPRPQAGSRSRNFNKLPASAVDAWSGSQDEQYSTIVQPVNDINHTSMCVTVKAPDHYIWGSSILSACRPRPDLTAYRYCLRYVLYGADMWSMMSIHSRRRF